MIVPLVEAAKCDLLSKADLEDLAWIRELAVNLALKLTARVRGISNKDAAIAAYLLWNSPSRKMARTVRRGSIFAFNW
jgi:hypothetical protein